MIGSTFVCAASTLLAMSAVVTTAQECSPDVSQSFLATITNTTYFDTCAPGKTFNVTSVLDVFNFTSADLMTFCNSSVCLEPIHKLMGTLDCNIMYLGMSRNLSSEISKLHSECHEALEAVEGSGHGMDMSMDMDMDNTAGSPGQSGYIPPAGSGASSIALMTVSVLSAAVLTVFLA